MECSNVLRSLQKNEMFSRSFTFFEKECCILCVLFRSLEKNGKERNVLLGLISRQKLKKRMEKDGTFFKRKEHSLKERKRTECSERKRTRCPTLLLRAFIPSSSACCLLYCIVYIYL